MIHNRSSYVHLIMSCKPSTPEYFTLCSVCPYDGSFTVLGIFENMDAVVYRMKQMYSSCGSEYRIECFHLTTAEDEAVKYNEQQVNRAKAKLEKQVENKEAVANDK